MKFFQKLGLFVSRLFVNIEGFVKEHITPSVETVKRLADLVNSPVADAVTALIPGDTDDKAKQWVRRNLNKAVAAVVPVADIVNEPDFATKIKKLADYIKKQPVSLQKGLLFRISSEMATSSAGKKQAANGHSVDLLCQAEYSKVKAGEGLENCGIVYCEHCGTPQ